MTDDDDSPGLPAPVVDPARQVKQWLVEGIDAEDIREALATTHPHADVDRLLTAAAEHFRTIAGADPTVIRGWAFDAYRDLYQKMVRIGDFAGAARVVERLERLATRK